MDANLDSQERLDSVGNLGSEIANSLSQVKETVKAYRVPDVTFSTRCKFSAPDVNMETRPVNNKG